MSLKLEKQKLEEELMLQLKKERIGRMIGDLGGSKITQNVIVSNYNETSYIVKSLMRYF